MAIPIEPIYARIIEAPTTPAPAGDHQYVADIQTPSGRQERGIIGHSVGNFWPLPLHVRPLPVGRLIQGLRAARQMQWDYIEVAHFGPCNQPGGLLQSGGSQLRLLLQSASRDDLLFLKKMLEGVQ